MVLADLVTLVNKHNSVFRLQFIIDNHT